MVSRHSRRAFLAVTGSAGLGGCLERIGLRPATYAADAEGETLDVDFDITVVGEAPPEGEPSRAPPFSEAARPLPLEPGELANQAMDGGVPKDGIPSIDDPKFIEADEVDFLTDTTAVLGVRGDDVVRAYPRLILVQHEIVNDHLEGTPVSVTYCPLTGTGLGFERGETEFGVSGQLINNNLIMYDREMERWWPQLPGCSIPGPWSESPGGATLKEFRLVRTSWERWRAKYPETVVLSTDTGYARSYDQSPYDQFGYTVSREVFFPNIYVDDRHHPKDWVFGVRRGRHALAIHEDRFREEGTIHTALGGDPVVGVWDRDLRTAYIYDNPDRETFSLDVDGQVSDGSETYAPEALPLDPIHTIAAYWFAWIAYYPRTTIID